MLEADTKISVPVLIQHDAQAVSHTPEDLRHGPAPVSFKEATLGELSKR